MIIVGKAFLNEMSFFYYILLNLGRLSKAVIKDNYLYILLYYYIEY